MDSNLRKQAPVETLADSSVRDLNQIANVEFSTKYFDVGFLTKNTRSQTQNPTFIKLRTNNNYF